MSVMKEKIKKKIEEKEQEFIEKVENSKEYKKAIERYKKAKKYEEEIEKKKRNPRKKKKLKKKQKRHRKRQKSKKIRRRNGKKGIRHNTNKRKCIPTKNIKMELRTTQGVHESKKRNRTKK